MQRLPFSAHTNRILHTIPVLCRFEQSQFFKLQHKAADRRVSGVPEVLFQLLGGKLHVAVSGQNKLPQCFLLLSDLSVGQGGLKRLGRLCGRKHPVQLMIAECTLNCKVEIRFLIIFNASPYCLFPDDENRKFSVYYMELAPGSRWQSEPHLRGTTEFVTLFAGAIEIAADQKDIVVQAGESVRFQGDTTHAYRNISDQTTILHMILYNP